MGFASSQTLAELLQEEKPKEHRQTLFDNVQYVDKYMEFKGSVEAGDFFLYGEKEYNELYNTLSK